MTGHPMQPWRTMRDTRGFAATTVANSLDAKSQGLQQERSNEQMIRTNRTVKLEVCSTTATSKHIYTLPTRLHTTKLQGCIYMRRLHRRRLSTVSARLTPGNRTRTLTTYHHFDIQQKDVVTGYMIATRLTTLTEDR